MPAVPQDLNDQMVDHLRTSGVLHSPDVERAFRRVSRHHFLPALEPSHAFVDEAIVTHRQQGSDEWISSSSQPTMMAIMLEQLAVQPGMRVLEIGAGTGYNAALLAELTGQDDLVWTVDVTPEFCDEARAHLAAAGQPRVHVICADGWQGWSDGAPYDRIIVTASAYDIAPAWAEQLANNGLLVLPWGLSHAPQRALTFRKAGGCLVQQSSTRCFFMSLRGQQAEPPALPPFSPDHWEQPWEGAPPPPDSHLEDLAFFLSLFVWPLTAGVFWEGDGPELGPTRLGLVTGGSRVVAQIDPHAKWNMTGQGDREIAQAVQTRTAQWVQAGRPTPEQIHLTACPRGTLEEGEDIARRAWFDYRVQWGHGLPRTDADAVP